MKSRFKIRSHGRSVLLASVLLVALVMMVGCRQATANRTARESAGEAAKEAAKPKTEAEHDLRLDFNPSLSPTSGQPIPPGVFQAVNQTFWVRIDSHRGMEGAWAQKGKSWRFENAAGNRVVIGNAAGSVLWETSPPWKEATQRPLVPEVAAAYGKLGPRELLKRYQLLKGTVEGPKFKAILTNGTKVALSWDDRQLPILWRLQDKSGVRFLRWTYSQVGSVPDASFELPKETKIKPVESKTAP